ncbi:MAG: saccharopine dehydrogenase NADP-binding domain-containing protein [Planctomycetes bacterium]|nr:saccharopine dehydrogenase NADP-binding domain-containing protein [Planctomycetota bacterium]
MSGWLLYGATGYTGRLIAREAVKRGLRPILTGRDRKTVGKLADELGCESRVFALNAPASVAANLHDVQAVLNCAGPFARTAPTMIAACIQAKVSYLDITGEIEVIEYAAAQNDAARAAGVVVMPAVGFDVVPTDCLAATLAAAMPGATHLTLAFTGSETSPGTAKTILAGLPEGGRARVAGRIEKVPVAWKKRTIPFSTGPREATSIPWGDVASAYYTTGIPNIDVLMAVDEVSANQMRKLRKLAPLLKLSVLRSVADWLVDRLVKGPTDDDMAKQRTHLWGETRDAAGRTASATLDTPNGYRLTSYTAVAAVERLLKGGVEPGFQTPARAFGKEFILTMPDVQMSSIVVSEPPIA